VPQSSGFELDEYVAPEVALQASGAAAFDRLLRPPAQWTAFPAGHLLLDGAQAARLTRIGLKRSWPDHLVLYDGILIGIEWKRPGEEALSISRVVRTRGGKQRWVAGQREVFPLLKAAGMKGPYVCTSVEAALKILAAYDVPMLKWEVTA
jgi:hypothetical protein